MKKEIVIESFHGSQINNQRIVNLWSTCTVKVCPAGVWEFNKYKWIHFSRTKKWEDQDQ